MRGSAAARLLGLRFRISPGVEMSVSCKRCLLSGRGLCVGLITVPEESYWVWSWGLDTEEAVAYLGLSSHENKNWFHLFVVLCTGMCTSMCTGMCTTNSILFYSEFCSAAITRFHPPPRLPLFVSRSSTFINKFDSFILFIVVLFIVSTVAFIFPH